MKLIDPTQITGNVYICSLHFIGGKGLKKEYPDPIPAVGGTVDIEHYINPILTESNLIETNDNSVQTDLTMDAINAYIHVTVRMITKHNFDVPSLRGYNNR